MTKTDGRNIGYACCGIIGFVISIISIICWLEYASNLEISEVQCYVNKVDIPQSLPNNTYEHMWAKCNCGRYCKAKTPVADIYVQLNGEGESIRTKYKKLIWLQHKLPEKLRTVIVNNLSLKDFLQINRFLLPDQLVLLTGHVRCLRMLMILHIVQ